MPGSNLKRKVAETVQEFIPRRRLDVVAPPDQEYGGRESWIIIRDDTTGALEKFLLDPTQTDDSQILCLANDYPVMIHEIFHVQAGLSNTFSTPLVENLHSLDPINPQVAEYSSLADHFSNYGLIGCVADLLPAGKSVFWSGIPNEVFQSALNQP